MVKPSRSGTISPTGSISLCEKQADGNAGPIFWNACGRGKARSMTLPSITDLKAQAKRLRAALPSGNGQVPTHGQTLDLIARQYGYRDWNTLFAAKGNQPDLSLSPGDKVSGTYLHQAFTGTLVSVSRIGTDGWLRVAIDFDTPVDVVAFDSFSAFRKRINATIGPDGHTVEKTSDGQPHLVLKKLQS